MNFKDKKVTIMGLGLLGGGVGAVKFFSRQGADVLITDLRTEEELESSLKKLEGLKIDYVLGKHREEDFIEADLVIKNPSVPKGSPFLKLARKNNVPVKTDIEIFFDLFKGKIIGITGTKGKSTVATLLFSILKAEFPDVVLAGNIGVSPLEVLEAETAVLELSSFELEDLKKSPPFALITNILPDHLNRHRSLKDYAEAKKKIFLYQKKEDVLILNYDLKDLSSEAKSQVFFYSLEDKTDCHLEGNEIFFKEESILNVKDILIKGRHNVSNVLAVVLAAKLLGVSSNKIKREVLAFKGVPFRQQFITEINGVKYFNDTTATMPEAAVEALRTFSESYPDSKIILIAGGENKGLDFKEMAREIEKRTDSLILLPGSASKELEKELKNVIRISSMKEAVQEASSLAEKGDIVLLSPGAASFNLFDNEFDRGEQFNKEVKSLK